jgi:hypothetical protein
VASSAPRSLPDYDRRGSSALSDIDGVADAVTAAQAAADRGADAA